MDNTKGKSLTKNSAYYLAYNVLNVVFPFITSIYVARVIPVDLVGRVSYAQNIVQYFALLSFLGIPTYGIREISKNRNNSRERNKIYTELIVLNAISTTFFSLLYFFVVLIWFRDNLILYSVVGFSVVVNYLNISWLYEGLEEYKFISGRNIVFKVICLILLFLLVREPEDYILYATITVFGVAGNYFINVIKSPKFVQLSFEELDLKRHLKSIMLFVAVNLAIEIYTLVDITMIGLLCEERFVAYYAYGSKINKILIQIMHTFTMVIVPRIAFHYNEGNKNEFNKIISLTLKIICLLGVPLIIGIHFCSDYAIILLFGRTYARSSQVLKILSLSILVSPIGYLLGSRVMLVTNNEAKMPICVGVGAVANVFLNWMLIPHFMEYGAAVASVISETIVMVVYLVFSHKYYTLLDYKASIVKIIIASTVMIIILWLYHFIKPENVIGLVLQICIGAVCYLGSLFMLKEETLVGLIKEGQLWQ